ncbi:unnamed protein product [Vitrella brassicaformis CCMP3155]|uniref:Uncharacterized protein n=1 Tax=Vitrella brassicaformis (strain CCMP3155) TaxID=1169540 RepID=A0A0G4FWJ4_VITBC|nr:unnamed protein product [Vitrella brassicaformis CCMP3155]|eukprot:CEM19593.1 unnamed protein product [Vitrella brassicaformis CCMP3155]
MDADEQRQLREDAQLASDSLKRLMQLQTKVDEHLTQIKQRTEPDNKDTVASARELRVHLSLLTAQCNAAATQLSTLEPLLASAVDALIAIQLSTLEPLLASAVDVLIATAAEPQAPVDTVEEQPQAAPAEKSYRLIYESGQPPNKNVPARFRLSRDEPSDVFGHLQPWELTRYRRPLGTPLFHQSAANYTHLVIDCKDDTARRMWETMPLAVAQRWGKRATTGREIKHRYPESSRTWCRGTWVALVEGRVSGRAAIAEKERQEGLGGEGAAAAAAGQAYDGSQSADESSLELLSFEEVKLERSIRIPDPPPSSDLPPAPSAPVHLPALKTVDNIPSERLAARVGRKWWTPAVKTLIIRRRVAALDVEGARAWLPDCDAIEALDLDSWRAERAAGVLSALPADGKSLAALQTLRGIMLWDLTAIDRLREVLVARGVKRSISELKIDIVGHLWNTDEDWERLQKAAQLVDAVAHSQALLQRIVRDGGGHGRIIYMDMELLSRSSSTGTPTVQKLAGEYAKTVDFVAYSGGDEAHRVAITDDTFPAAHTLRLTRNALADAAKKNRALEIASHMPSLSCIQAGDHQNDTVLNAPVSEMWMFLERLQAALVSKGRERSLTLEMLSLSVSAFADERQSPCLWWRDSNEKLPPIKEVTVYITDVVGNGQLETFYQRVMASVASFSNELKGHKKTTVRLWHHVRTDFERRFLAEQATLNFNGGPYKFSSHRYGLVVERRT